MTESGVAGWASGETDGGAGSSFDRMAGWSALLAGVGGLAYAISFFIIKDARLWAFFLTVSPLFATVALVAVYQRLRAVDGGLALFVLLIGFVSGIGASIHGGYDLALAINPVAGATILPASPVDPRGLLTFGLSGVALLGTAWLVARSREFPNWVAPLAALTGIALVATYLGRLVILDAGNILVYGPAAAAGILSSVVYFGLGLWLLGWAFERRGATAA